MKQFFSLILFFIITLVLLISCTKHKGDIEENLPVAIINFESPTLSSVYSNGDSVTIKGTAISTATMHGYDIIIRKVNDTTTVFFKHIHDHNDTLSINQKWKNNVSVAATMEAQVVLYLDHEGHTGTKKAYFKVQ
jgi:hypothetical protein